MGAALTNRFKSGRPAKSVGVADPMLHTTDVHAKPTMQSVLEGNDLVAFMEMAEVRRAAGGAERTRRIGYSFCYLQLVPARVFAVGRRPGRSQANRCSRPCIASPALRAQLSNRDFAGERQNSVVLTSKAVLGKDMERSREERAAAEARHREALRRVMQSSQRRSWGTCDLLMFMRMHRDGSGLPGTSAAVQPARCIAEQRASLLQRPCWDSK